MQVRLIAVRDEMRSREAIEKAIKEISEKVKGCCPNDPFYAACHPEIAVETLQWVLEKAETIMLQTDEGVFKVLGDGEVEVELYFTTTD